MLLDISNGGGDFNPYVKYNAKAGRWYTKQDGQEVEVQNPTFVADFDNIKTGWFTFTAGQAPEKVFDPSLTQRAEKPHDGAKRGFQVDLFSNESFGGVVELASTSNAMSNAINPMYERYSKEKDANAGQLPVIKVTGVKPIQNDHGTNYEPLFEFVKWVARPDAFDGGESVDIETSAPAPAASVSEF